jgi:chromosome partitioning protein
LIACCAWPSTTRSAVIEAQASGDLLWEMKKTAARDAWAEIEPTMRRLAEIVDPQEHRHAA